MSILMNAVFLSVLIMVVLCVLRLNVLISIIIAALIAGWLSPIGAISQDSSSNIFTAFLHKTMTTGEILINGMAGNLNIALSYILLGAIAAAIARTHLMTCLLSKLATLISNKKAIFILSIALISCCSQNLIPIHIAFIPILIPPLISLMNRLKIDRRAVACALTFGLQAPYVTIGVGFGLTFHTMIRDQMGANQLPVSLSDIASVMWIGGLSMLIGLFVAIFILYAKPREYTQSAEHNMKQARMGWQEYAVLFGIVVAFIGQLVTQSLPLGAFAGLMCMIALGGIKWSEIDSVMEGGLKMMAFIAFVMLAAAGYGEVLRQSGEVKNLVDSIVSLCGIDLASLHTMSGEIGTQASFWAKLIGASLMLIVGLLVTMGIGTSFGTIPIIAAIYVPFGLSLGFSTPAIILLIGIAGALGDAGSPASDSTLGPTSGLNVDGQHNHIADTCIPTFLVYNIPLLLAGVIGAMLL